jgi:hypothetical protein
MRPRDAKVRLQIDSTTLADWVIDHFGPLLFGVVAFVGSIYRALLHGNFDLLGLFCLTAPLGFLNTLYGMAARPNELNALFIILATVIGCGVGWLAQVITQWKPKAVWLIAILLIVNSCGFIWFFAQSLED